MISLLNVFATFNVGIGKDDIEEGILLPEDWYTMQILTEPKQDKNSAWKDAGENLGFEEASELNEKAGENIIVHLNVISDIPEYNGRRFTKWLPLINPNDEGKFMNDGQKKADWKAQVIHTWVEAFGGLSEGTEVSLSEGQKALVYVIQEEDNREGGKFINSISMNVAPRTIGVGGSGLGEGLADGGPALADEAPPTNDLPF